MLLGRSYLGARHRWLRPQRFPQGLRRHFEVSRHYIAVAALRALADDGLLAPAKVAEAIAKYHIDGNKINPLHA